MVRHESTELEIIALILNSAKALSLFSDIDECTKARHNCKPTHECKNNQGSYKCICRPGYYGEDCNIPAVSSCKEAYEKNITRASGEITLLLDSKPVPIFCHMENFECGDGGWTPVMKIDGNKKTFEFDSTYWEDKKVFQPEGGKTGFNSKETKLPTYWSTPFSKICLGMRIDRKLRFVIINKTADSLYSMIADRKYRNTSLGRDTWRSLVGPSASLQLNCNKEGFNADAYDDPKYKIDFSKARIGIIGNNQDDCQSCDSRIGFGTGGHPNQDNTCGNAFKHKGTHGKKKTKAMGYILVQ
ncbi:uncharacterized skeletal organic matrix protein 5-like [Stylophora pistillata]|uniref:uncharacterized skeletal organic matrix protein 5-like n=1 Tax=Stylophora pistillata TaxID=50429 RepID=UPI000C04A849|nr:uncharacterized skeletal organic matrix protein 5-like [Stylophora pistillata]